MQVEKAQARSVRANFYACQSKLAEFSVSPAACATKAADVLAAESSGASAGTLCTTMGSPNSVHMHGVLKSLGMNVSAVPRRTNATPGANDPNESSSSVRILLPVLYAYSVHRGTLLC